MWYNEFNELVLTVEGGGGIILLRYTFKTILLQLIIRNSNLKLFKLHLKKRSINRSQMK